MAAVDIANINFDVEISEKSDLDIVLASINESCKLVTEEDVNAEEYENLDCIRDNFSQRRQCFLSHIWKTWYGAKVCERHDSDYNTQTSTKIICWKSRIYMQKMYKKLSVKSNISKTCWYLSRSFITCQKKIEKSNQLERLINRKMMTQVCMVLFWNNSRLKSH